ncbi:IclR family transcriptional regulator [Pseudalkalibacillus sp. A8]|uniref:IclR family transcriptional regulator n=1 Tax=Pseudalkalibacillus sp. A8 TaxID=3382641 RepID=UPI0038B42D61
MRKVNMKPILSVERAVDILFAFSSQKKEMTVEEISNITQIPNSTVYRILCTLESKKMVQFDEKTLGYKPGLKLFELGSFLPNVLDVREEAKELLDKLHYETGQTVVMAVRDDDQILYIYKKEKEGEGLKYVSVVGQRRHFLYGVVGPAILAFMPEKTVEQVMNRPIPQNSPYPLNEKENVLKQLQQIREQKLYVDHNKHSKGVTGISAPIFNMYGEAIAAFAVIGPTIQFDHVLQRFEKLVYETSKKISSKMGYRY